MKNEIIEYLLSRGFVPAAEIDRYERKMRKAVQEVIMNGERHVEYQTIVLAFLFIGDGWEGNSETDNHPLTQWKFLVNDFDQGDFLVHDLEEFKNIFR